MRRFLVAALVGLVARGAFAAAALPASPPTLPPRQGDTFSTGLSDAVTVASDSTACTTPGGAHCTVVLASTNVGQWDDWTLYLTVTGAAAVTNVLIEVSADGTNWSELAARSLDGIAAATTHSANVTGHYRYVRIEARAASDTALKVAITGSRI